MSVLNAIQSLFGGAATHPQPPVPPGTPGMGGNPSQVMNPGAPLPGTHSSNVTAPNGLVPDPNAPQQLAPGQETPPSPFEPFKDIWNTPIPAADDPNTKPIFSGLDPKKVLESARQVDFSKAITPEALTAIVGGGEGAAKAFATAMNTVAQTVYAQNAVATTKIVEQALEKQAERYNANLPAMVRKFSANENLLADNPLLSNPAVQPLVGALTEQLSRKNPGATQAEIESKVNGYFLALGNAFAAKPDPVKNASTRGETDWNLFLQ